MRLFWYFDMIRACLGMYAVAPVCRPGQKTIYSGGRQETIKVLCELEANPHNVTFNWKFNASAAEFLDLPASQIFPERNNAVAQYTPMTERVSTYIHNAKESFRFICCL